MIFISYSRKDNDYLEKIVKDIEEWNEKIMYRKNKFIIVNPLKMAVD
jgi:hypothetical protein